MTTDKPRSAAPIIGLGVLAAAIALTGVGVAASGAADKSSPSSLQGGPSAVSPSAAPTLASPTLAPPTAADGVVGPLSGSTGPAAGAGAGSSVAPTQAAGSSSAPATASPATPTATSSSADPSASGKTAAKPRASAKPTSKTSVKASATDSASSAGASTAPDSSAAGAGAVPGNYAETTTGTAAYAGSSMPVNGTPTLVVSAASGQAQTQTVNDGSSSQVEKLVFGTNRVDTTEISISSQVIDSDFVISPQEPLVELTAGATWSWKADSTDGKEHLALTGSYAGTEQVTTGGQVETASIVKSTLTLTGSVSATITLTDDYDPTYKLIPREHSVIKGSYMGIPFTIDTMTTLNSLKPS